MGKGQRESNKKNRHILMDDEDNDVFYTNKRKTKKSMGVYKWFFKAFLTQIGCLSSEESLCGTGTDSLDYLLAESHSSQPPSPQSQPRGQKQQQYLQCKDQISRDRAKWLGLNGCPFDNCDEENDGVDNKYLDKDIKGTGTMSFQNSTLPAQNGEYYASFTEKSFTKGKRFKVYSGIYVGGGSKRGEKCVVKVFSDRPGTRNLCSCEVNKSSKARELARKFNQLNHGTSIRITSLYWAPMDEISVIKKLFFSGRRKLTTKEVVLFEDDLRVNEDKPGKLRKLIPYMDSIGRSTHCKAKDLEAFAHFSYHSTNGDLVLCGLEGVQEEEGFAVKTPTIHSRKRKYGTSDLAEHGIAKFFENHVCNEICRDMIKYNPDIERLNAVEEEIEALSVNDNRRVPRNVDQTEYRLDLRRGSTGSHLTERISNLEPTAPCLETMDTNHQFQNLPLGYILREHLEFCDIEDIHRTGITTQMSVDSDTYPQNINQCSSSSVAGAEGVSYPTTSGIANSIASSSVFDEGYGRSESTEVTHERASSSCCAVNGDVSSNNYTMNGRRVHFSTSGTEATSNCKGDTTGNGSPKTYPSSIMKRQTSLPMPPTRCSNACEDSLARIVWMQARRPSMPEPAEHQAFPPHVVPVYAIPDEPPSYTQSQQDYFRTYAWLLQHQTEMNGPPAPAMDTNGNQVLPTVANVRHQ